MNNDSERPSPAAGILLRIIALETLTIFLLATVPDFVSELSLGWFHFLGAVLPKIRIRWDGIAIFIFLFLFCIACTHYLLAWLANEIGTRRGQSIRWRRRSSAALVSMLLLVFVIGMCMTGVVHQAGWLINAPVSFYVAEMQTQQDSDQSLYRPFEVDTSIGQNWLAASLVFIRYEPINIDSTKAWNAPENEAPFRKFIPEVICPSRSNPKRSPDGFALSQIAANPIMVNTPNLRSSDLKDAAQTIFAGEVNAAFMPWGSKGNSRALELGIQKNWSGVPRGKVGYGSVHSAGANFAFADGSVQFQSDNTDKRVLEALGRIKKE